MHKSICAKNAPKKDEFLKKTQWLKKNEVDELYMCAAMSIKNSNYINQNVDNAEQIQQGKRVNKFKPFNSEVFELSFLFS